MQSLDIISVNFWQILVSLCNLLILFFVIKKFLFAPVEKMLSARQAEIDKQYDKADEALSSAKHMENEWSEKMTSADNDADKIIKAASENADRQSRAIIDGAKSEASAIIDRAKLSAELEIKNAQDGIKREIVDVSTAISEKILEREINEDDHKALIDSFISEIGDKK